MPARPFQFRLRNGLWIVAVIAVILGLLKRSVTYSIFAFMALITVALAGIAAWSLTRDSLQRLRERTAQPARSLHWLALILSIDTLGVVLVWLVVFLYGLVLTAIIVQGFSRSAHS